MKGFDDTVVCGNFIILTIYRLTIYMKYYF